MASGSAMSAPTVYLASDEGFDAFDGHGVVDGSAHAADGTVALDVDEAVLRAAFDELGIEFVRIGDEGNVHEGAVFLDDGAFEHLAFIEIVVKDGRFGFVASLHLLEAAHLEEPLEDEACHVDAPAGRRVVHGAGTCHGLIVEHGRRDVSRVAEQVFADDADGETCGGDVLLSAAVEHAELRDVEGLGQEAGRDVSDERYIAGLGEVTDDVAVDGLVHADVEVVRIGTELGGVDFRDTGEVLVRAGCDDLDIAVAGRLCGRLLGPDAGDDVVRFAAAVHEVQGDGGELSGRTALQEQDFVVVRDVHEGAKVRFRLVDDRLILFAAVGHLHDGFAGALVVEELIGSFVEDGFREHGRARGEVEYSGHIYVPPIKVIDKRGAAG